MDYPSFIGARYLRSRKKSSISAIGIIAIAGVALGVASLSVGIAIFSGFEEECTDKVLGVNSHLLVMKYGLDFSEYREVMENIQKMPEARGVAPFVIQEMMISKGDKTTGVLLKGTDPERVGNVLDLPKHIVKGGLEGLRIPGSLPAKERETWEDTPVSSGKGGAAEVNEVGDAGVVSRRSDELPNHSPSTGHTSPSPGSGFLPGIVLGKKLAEQLEADVGDAIQVTTPRMGLDVLGWSPSQSTLRTLSFKVVGIFYAGFLEYDTRLAYADYYQVQRFFEHGDSVTGIELTLWDRYKAKEVGERLRRSLGNGPYHVIDWMMLNDSLFTALKMQKTALTMVLAVIVGVAAFNIIATLVMMVFDKRREIAILKSMGATHAGIARVFLHVGLVVGLIGIGIGLAVGLGVCILLQEVGWPLDPKVYLIDHLPVRLEPIDFMLTAGIAFLICLLATILPSLSASRLHPVDGLRKN